MNNEILRLFIKEDCDDSVRKLLLDSISSKIGTGNIQEFNFNRFNVVLDFAKDEVAIDDEINPSEGGCRVSIDAFKSLIKMNTRVNQ